MKTVRLRNGQTKTIALFGKTLHYSQSPQIQNDLISDHGINAVYVPFEFSSDSAFEEAIRALSQSPSFLGANFTNPFKRLVTTIKQFQQDQRVATIGAANTLFRNERQWQLTNTDVDGIIKTIEMSGLFTQDEEFDAIILGAGGAAAAATYALSTQYPSARIHLHCRVPEKIRGYLKTAARSINQIDRMYSHDEHISLKTLLINTIPLGQNGEENPYAQHLIRKRSQSSSMDTFYFDMTYGENPSVQLAKESGILCCDGKLMLMTQAKKSFALWKASLETN